MSDSTSTDTTPADYVYEFMFLDNYSDDIMNAYPDTSNELIDVIKNTLSSLKNILNLRPGIRTISTYANLNNQRFKVTLTNSNWQPPLTS
jgi:hypothetical protein